MEKDAKNRCLRCGIEYAVPSSSALYAEAFCGQECERLFAQHVIEFYGVKCETKILAWMSRGEA